ncbi:hypothetical protein HKCCE2091_09885 [Rhodobacterales bacterium HKCCE2091]|nr:hypothetical protein [Rhodobacterales bacterium HKCCE2091]
MLKTFLRDDSGAITIDWVVIAGAATALGLTTAAAISSASGNFAQGVGEELRSDYDYTNPFDEDDPGSYDWTFYQPLSPWLDYGWAETAYDDWSHYSDAQLVASYNYQYQFARIGNNSSAEQRTFADYLSVSERIMYERGIDIPAGNMTAEEIRGLYH